MGILDSLVYILLGPYKDKAQKEKISKILGRKYGD
jgi:hypothetical protein